MLGDKLRDVNVKAFDKRHYHCTEIGCYYLKHLIITNKRQYHLTAKQKSFIKARW